MLYRKGDIVLVFDAYKNKYYEGVIILPIMLGNRYYYRVAQAEIIGQNENKQILIQGKDIVELIRRNPKT